jgi:serine/threonine-protein kinase
MTDDTRSRAYQLLRAACDLPNAEREPFLAEKQVEEPEAALAAARMLRNCDASGDIDPPKVISLGGWGIDREGTVIDDWHVHELLEQGGFGRVYRASRPTADGEKEVVAVKFLDVAPAQVARFLRERQTLAELSHEGICKFINGGTTPDGTPYMVMEYVPGIPITSYCNKDRLSITSRLKLFVKLCQAVEYAHQKGVLHRDLKPANILVTAAGVVRVIDFGVARLLDPIGRNAHPLTEIGEAPWTKAYAAPEQVRGEDLSLATDVYCLGVVLYELVSGQLPFSELALNGPDWAQVIAEREPLPPSQACLAEASHAENGKFQESTEAEARLRRTSPGRLKRKLAGNLDAVVLKALRKAASQRYARVERLRSDIELLLEGLPVTARRCGLWERVRNRSAKCPVTTALIAASILCVVYPFSRGFPGQIADRVALREREDAVGRLQHLTESGLPGIEDSLPRGPEARAARLLTARIHTRLLQNVEVLPDYTLRDLDSSLAVSALRCAEEWRSLGDPREALAVTAPILPRAATRYELDRLDRRRREAYAQILRQRIELHRSVNQEAEAEDETRLLEEVEARRH